MLSPRGQGAGMGWGFDIFLKNIVKIHTPGTLPLVKNSNIPHMGEIHIGQITDASKIVCDNSLHSSNINFFSILYYKDIQRRRETKYTLMVNNNITL